MASLYGKHWLDMWEGMPQEAVQAEWYAKLQGIPVKAIMQALEVCAEKHKFPPTLPEFLQICKAHMPKTFNRALPRFRTAEQKARAGQNYQELRRQLGWK